jgi:hypothetical protein
MEPSGRKVSQEKRAQRKCYCCRTTTNFTNGGEKKIVQYNKMFYKKYVLMQPFTKVIYTYMYYTYLKYIVHAVYKALK